MAKGIVEGINERMIVRNVGEFLNTHGERFVESSGVDRIVAGIVEGINC